MESDNPERIEIISKIIQKYLIYLPKDIIIGIKRKGAVIKGLLKFLKKVVFDVRRVYLNQKIRMEDGDESRSLHRRHVRNVRGWIKIPQTPAGG